MASINRSKSVLSQLFINLFLSLVYWAIAISCWSGDCFSSSGRVKIPGISMKEFGSPGGKVSNAKVILSGGQSLTFLRPDGFFSLARNPGKVQATLSETRRDLNELVLEPLGDEQYYEIRDPFSIMSVVKSPMGLLMGFMLVVVFLMPKLMENMDSEEMRRAQEEMRGQGVPSLTNLLPGAGRS